MPSDIGTWIVSFLLLSSYHVPTSLDRHVSAPLRFRDLCFSVYLHFTIPQLLRHIEGFPVGIIGNNGMLFSESAIKASRQSEEFIAYGKLLSMRLQCGNFLSFVARFFRQLILSNSVENVEPHWCSCTMSPGNGPQKLLQVAC